MFCFFKKHRNKALKLHLFSGIYQSYICTNKERNDILFFVTLYFLIKNFTMKILKAFLLAFTLTFTMSNVNAQQSICSTPFSMVVKPLTRSTPPGEACFETTVTSDSPALLFIKAIGNRTIPITTEEVTSFTAIVCTERFIGMSYPFTIECGINNSNGDALCRDSCIIDIDGE